MIKLWEGRLHTIQSLALDFPPGSDGAAQTANLSSTTAGPATTAPSDGTATSDDNHASSNLGSLPPSAVQRAEATMSFDWGMPIPSHSQVYFELKPGPTAVPDIMILESSTGGRYSPPIPEQSPEHLKVPEEDTKASRNAKRREEARKRKRLEWLKENIASETGKTWVYLAQTVREADEDSIYDGDYDDSNPNAGLSLPDYFQPEDIDDDEYLATASTWRPRWSKEAYEAQMKYEYKYGQHSTRTLLKDSFTNPPSTPAGPWTRPTPSLGAIAEEEDEGPYSEHIEHSGRELETSVEGYISDSGIMRERKKKGKGKANEDSEMGISKSFLLERPRSLSPSAPLMFAIPSQARSPSFSVLSNRPSPAAGRFYLPSPGLAALGTSSSSTSSMDHIPRSAPTEIPAELLNQVLYDVQGTTFIPRISRLEDDDADDKDSEPEGRQKEQATRSPSSTTSSEEDLPAYRPDESEDLESLDRFSASNAKKAEGGAEECAQTTQE